MRCATVIEHCLQHLGGGPQVLFHQVNVYSCRYDGQFRRLPLEPALVTRKIKIDRGNLGPLAQRRLQRPPQVGEPWRNGGKGENELGYGIFRSVHRIAANMPASTTLGLHRNGESGPSYPWAVGSGRWDEGDRGRREASHRRRAAAAAGSGQ